VRVKDSSMPGTPSRIVGARMTFAYGSISALRSTLQISGRGQGMEDVMIIQAASLPSEQGGKQAHEPRGCAGTLTPAYVR
jgi:hypothetical protein